MTNFENLFISSAFKEIYNIPGSLIEFHDALANKPADSFGITYICELYPSTYYRHTAEQDMIVDSGSDSAQHLLASYNSERHCHCPASVIVRIDDATVHRSAIYCHQDDRTAIVYESFRLPDRSAINISPLLEDSSIIPDQYCFDGPCLYLGSAGSFNYGHWLVDDLPRARAWLELNAKLGVECTFVLPSFDEKIDAVRKSSIHATIDALANVAFIDPELPCRFRNLFYATPVSFHPRIKNPAAIRFLQQSASRPMGDFGRHNGRRIFVARRPPNSRAVTNFDELWAFLQVRGFELVEAEKLDFSAQVRIFQEAAIVVGQMGAAMTNSLFCAPSTTVIYLAPAGWAEPFYLDLAAVGGQHYNVLTGPTNGGAQVHLSDFVVPIDHLYHRLTYMGILPTP